MLLNIEMSGKTAVIIGGGKVAFRKAKALLAAGSELLVVAPKVLEDIENLARVGELSIRYANYQESDLEGAFLVVAATDDVRVNYQIAVDAGLHSKMVCVADAPEVGNCSFPAVLRRGDLEIGVSTGGACPSLAAEFRDFLSLLITEEYGTLVSRLTEEREKLLTEGNTSTYNTQVLRSLSRRLISELNKRKDPA